MSIDKIIGCLLLGISVGIAIVALMMITGIVSGEWIAHDTTFLIVWSIMAALGLGSAALVIGIFGVTGIWSTE